MKKPDGRHLIVLMHLLALCALAGLGPMSPWMWHAREWFYPLCVAIVVLYLWAVWSWTRIARSLFDPYVMFLTAATLFNGGHAFLEVFDLNRDGILRGAFSSETISRTLYAVALGLTAVHCGALLGAWVCRRRDQRLALNRMNGPLTRSFAWEDRACWLVGWCLFAIAIVPTLMLIRQSIAIVMSSGYFALYQQQRAVSFAALPRVLSSFLIPSAMFMLAASREQLSGRVISALIILGYAGIHFFLGSRVNAAMPLIAYAWLWHRRVGQLPALLLLSAGIVVLFIVFPLVSFIRMTPGAERMSLIAIWDALRSIRNPAVSILAEMGDSMRTIAYTLELVPASRPFDGGMTYLYGLLTIFPNAFWQVHPTVARGMASDWLVRTVAPAYAAAGGGFGYSFLAEAYLNFGWAGLLLVPAVIGFLLVRFVLWAQRGGRARALATVASFTSFFLVFARSEFGNMPRMLVWYALLPSLLVFLVLAFRSARDGQRHRAEFVRGSSFRRLGLPTKLANIVPDRDK
ncbi:MAG: O-antigen polysaccharide polymerase Wzy [Anaerolineae bacterium]